MIAELLDLPYISLATKFDLNNTTATVMREIEGGEETDEVNLPVVVSCQKGCCRTTHSKYERHYGRAHKTIKSS